MKTLVIITGPTGVGKTEAALGVAQRLHCHIINADSRQIYRGLPIGTAAPTAEQQRRVPHHFVACKQLDEQYSAWQFETDVMQLLPQLWQHGDYAVMCGGSMMYVDAVCNGIDPVPDISPQVRQAVISRYEQEGLATLLDELKERDPDYYEQVDRKNPRRVLHAVEICRQAGVPYSQLRTGTTARRPFSIVKVALTLPRAELFERINRRVDAMMAQGLEQEARSVYHLRSLNSLNTVGYKEMFAYFDGLMPLDVACERIKKNTRVYAKKQLTWLARDSKLTWCAPQDCLQTIEEKLKNTTNS